ncbi:MAG: glycosyl hydrolase [Ruminococcus sp.]|nr:glycosyl hydrolase [Ruminococcus sp.]
MNRSIFRKASAVAMSAAMAVNGTVFGSVSGFTTVAAGDSFEFEDAKITGDVTVESDSSASGGKYLKMTESGTIELTVNVSAAGAYDLTFYVSGIGSAKQQTLAVNGTSVGVLAIPEADGFEAVKVPGVTFKAGDNVVTITKSWGWSNFDKLEIQAFEYPEIKATQTTPCDSLATKETQSLMAYLASVYGKNIISGQQEIYSGGPHGLEYEFDYLKEKTGHYPAIRGFDYGNFCCPAYGSDDGSTKRIIEWVKDKNGIATASFHINVPNKMDSYKIGDRIDWSQTSYNAKDNDFSPKKAYTEGTKEYEYYRQSLETLAAEFKKLEAEGVPVIWRPLHEAEGGGGETGSWFWWGKEGSAVYKELWKYTYKTLTDDFGCHNLIWEWNSYDFSTSADWYPGDEYVDIIGYDKYNCVKYLAENNWQASYEHDDSAIASTFYSIMERYDSAKMVSMAENDCFSTVDNLVNDKAGWLYFCTWYDGGGSSNFLTDPIFNTEEDTIAMYQSDYCITLDELPADLYENGTDPDPSTTTATKATTTVSTTTATTVSTTAAFKFEAIKKSVVLPKGDKTGCYVEFAIKGAPSASLGGALGYGTNADDWTNVEWKGNADADGELIYRLALDDVPADITSAEVQVWWSNVWDAAQKAGIDQPCEITDVNVVTEVVTTTEAPETSTVTTATTTAEAAAVTLLGDANLDERVSVADAVAILQSLANSDKYALKPQGKANADCYDTGDGVTANDASAIQKLDAGAIKQLPDSSK